MSEEVKVKLEGSDGMMFEVDQAVAHESLMLKEKIHEDAGVENPIPIPMASEILAKVIDYCKYHMEAAKLSDEDEPAATDVQIKRWDRNFMKVDCDTLCALIRAAHFLDIEKLLDLTCQTLAKVIRNKTADEIRTMGNIKNDFTPFEEAEIRRKTYDLAHAKKPMLPS